MDDLEVEHSVLSTLKRICAQKGVYVFATSPEKYVFAHQCMLKHFTQTMQRNGIYLNISMNALRSFEYLKQHGVDPNRLHLVENVSRVTQNMSEFHQGSFLPHPPSITEITLALAELQSAKNAHFTFLDSINHLIDYHKEEHFERFSQHLVSKMKELGMSGVIFGREDGKVAEYMPLLTQFCDGCIHL